ncbi:hypothetical protein [Streptomyces sp. NPDC126514]|uniref:hypothetical protein n=1 Tax=Streptomyces sp. NPDC126514 TaxID=3155210 RepID=UPI00331A6E08
MPSRPGWRPVRADDALLRAAAATAANVLYLPSTEEDGARTAWTVAVSAPSSSSVRQASRTTSSRRLAPDSSFWAGVKYTVAHGPRRSRSGSAAQFEVGAGPVDVRHDGSSSFVPDSGRVPSGSRRTRGRRRIAHALDRFQAGRSDSGKPADAVEGVPALVEAAQEHRIDTLLIRSDGPELATETWVGAAPDQVAVRRTDARTLGEGDPVAVRADDALLRAAAATAANVLYLPSTEEDGADVPTGGLGALLRWTHAPSMA